MGDEAATELASGIIASADRYADKRLSGENSDAERSMLMTAIVVALQSAVSAGAQEAINLMQQQQNNQIQPPSSSTSQQPLSAPAPSQQGANKEGQRAARFRR